MSSLRAQSTDEAPPAPPMFSERTEDQVEEFLALAPPGPSDGIKPGLRVYSINHIEPGYLLAVLIGSGASLCLIAPGTLLIYASMQRQASSRALISSSLTVLSGLSLTWVLVLYSLSFARNAHSYDVMEKEIQVIDREAAPGSIFIGDLSRWGLHGLSSHWTAGQVHYPLRRMNDHIPEVHFMGFQLALFLQAVAPLLVITSGMWRPAGHALFWLLWSGLVYAPVTYWTQGGGWLAECIDGGSATSLYVCVGFTALGLLLFQRRSRQPLERQGSVLGAEGLVYVVIGGVLFLLGNLLMAAGRSIAFHPSATFDLLNILLAAATGLLTWTALEHRAGNNDRSAPVLGMVSGVAAIAAGCSSAPPVFAILIAVIAATGSFAVLHSWKAENDRAAWRLFAVHGVSGLIGLLLAAVVASADIAGPDSAGRPIVGLLAGNFEIGRVQMLTGGLVAALALAAGRLLPVIADLIGHSTDTSMIPEATRAAARVDTQVVPVK